MDSLIGVGYAPTQASLCRRPSGWKRSARSPLSSTRIASITGSTHCVRGVDCPEKTKHCSWKAALGLIPNGRKKFNPQAHIWQLPARFVEAYAKQDPISTLLLYENLN